MFKRQKLQRYLVVDKPDDAGDLTVTADAMEGLIGAVYLDSGVQSTLQVCARLGVIPTIKALQAEKAKTGQEEAGDGDLARKQVTECNTAPLSEGTDPRS